MGSCISGLGEQCHTRRLVLWEVGMKVTQNYFFLLLTNLRSVLISIKQYSDLMFSSILAENYESTLIYVK